MALITARTRASSVRQCPGPSCHDDKRHVMISAMHLAPDWQTIYETSEQSFCGRLSESVMQGRSKKWHNVLSLLLHSAAW
eukprot:1162092-Pelagomonas_calceolata.AAC.2